MQDHGLPAWRVGQWVRYDVTSRGRSWLVEYALVGKERNGGSQLFWLEARRFDSGDSLFVKCLVPTGLDGPAEQVLVGGTGLKCRLSVEGTSLPWSAAGSPTSTGKRQRPALVEELETPAGRFSSKKYGCPYGEIWLNPRVPVFGIVRSKSDDLEMLLVAYGLKGATSELRGAPDTEAVIY
jgi:hypothetical protein